MNLNFAIIYGAGASSFEGAGRTEERPMGMTLQEAEEFYAAYAGGLPTLFSYQDRLKRRCKKEGTVYTYFGLPRRVRFYFENRQAGYANRTILNHPIQGTAGDVLKITLCKLWNKILGKEEYFDDVRFLSTVHDEINFGVYRKRLQEISRKLELIMNFELAEWPVTLTTEVSFGFSWGGLFAHYWDEELKHYVPTLL